jgi:hypothetical protein
MTNSFRVADLTILYHAAENSQMPMARFQAAATMQEAAIREWALLSAEQRNSLRT